MRGIVQSRPFVKKTSYSSRKSFSFSHGRKRGKRNSAFLLFLKKWWFLVVASILVLVLVSFLLKGTWYNPIYLIKTIEYSQETRAEYENTELFVLASKFLRGKYYNTLRVGWAWKLTDRVKKEYPFVRDAHIDFLGNQNVKVDFTFYEPDFIVKMGPSKYGIWKGGFSEKLKENWNLGKDAFVVDTPSYLSWTNSLSGFFYEVGYDWYVQYLPLIQETFPTMNRFVYLAGSPSFVLFDQEKMIFLYRDDVIHQLQKYDRLKKYYTDYDKAHMIDLGSLTQEKVIVSM